jgi:hypothetical protein
VTTFEDVLPVADAVLYEGYVLYPYRADDAKNAVRWQFGVLAPPAYVAADPSERSALRAELLLDGRPTSGQLRLRFLQVQRRTVERAPTAAREDTTSPTNAQPFEPVDRLRVGDVEYLAFDEAVPQQVDVPVDLESLLDGPRTTEAVIPGGVEVELIPGGRLVRTRASVTASITTRARRSPDRTAPAA